MHDETSKTCGGEGTVGNPQDRWLRPYWALDYTQKLLISRAKLSSPVSPVQHQAQRMHTAQASRLGPRLCPHRYPVVRKSSRLVDAQLGLAVAQQLQRRVLAWCTGARRDPYSSGCLLAVQAHKRVPLQGHLCRDQPEPGVTVPASAYTSVSEPGVSVPASAYTSVY